MVAHEQNVNWFSFPFWWSLLVTGKKEDATAIMILRYIIFIYFGFRNLSLAVTHVIYSKNKEEDYKWQVSTSHLIAANHINHSLKCDFQIHMQPASNVHHINARVFSGVHRCRLQQEQLQDSVYQTHSLCNITPATFALTDINPLVL